MEVTTLRVPGTNIDLPMVNKKGGREIDYNFLYRLRREIYTFSGVAIRTLELNAVFEYLLARAEAAKPVE